MSEIVDLGLDLPPDDPTGLVSEPIHADTSLLPDAASDATTENQTQPEPDIDGDFLGGPIEAPETPAEIEAEKTTDQGDDTDPDLQWNEPDPVVEQIGKSKDELVIERLTANLFDPETATKYTKCLFYGDLGTRKTIGSCDANGMKVMLVAIESGMKSLRNHPEIMQHVKVMRVKSVRQIELLAEQLQKGAFPEFELIVLDTFSELQKKDLDIMVDAGMTDTSKNAWTKWAPEGKMYQGNTEHMRRIAAAFREVERNVIFTAHVREDKDENSRVFVRPDLTDKVAKTLGSYVDLQAYFYKEEDEEGKEHFFAKIRGSRGPDGRRLVVKTRIGNLPDVIETPSFAQIHAADISYTEQEQTA